MGVGKMDWIWVQQLLLHWFEIKQVREDDWDENISSPGWFVARLPALEPNSDGTNAGNSTADQKFDCKFFHASLLEWICPKQKVGLPPFFSVFNRVKVPSLTFCLSRFLLFIQSETQSGSCVHSATSKDNKTVPHLHSSAQRVILHRYVVLFYSKVEPRAGRLHLAALFFLFVFIFLRTREMNSLPEMNRRASIYSKK